MPREPKPYIKGKWYCTSAGGIPHRKLCRVSEGLNKAEQELARLLAPCEVALPELVWGALMTRLEQVVARLEAKFPDVWWPE